MTDFQHVLIRGEIPVDIPEGSVLDIQAGSTTTHTHGFHKYPGKFIPQIPRWAMRKYLGKSAGKIVLDPFCGSGTTLVEAVLSGNMALGVDIDPLSVMISEVKSRAIDPKFLRQTAARLNDHALAKQRRYFRPECGTLEHWFSPDAILKLGRIRAAIEDLPTEFGDSPQIRQAVNFWRICFSSIVRRASNADNESQKTFVSRTNPKKAEDATALFCRQSRYFVERMERFAREIQVAKNESRVYLADGGDLPLPARNAAVDLIVTSPPYIKAIDYMYNQMVELFWIGDLFGLQTQALQNLRKPLYIGNKQISVDLYRGYCPEQESTGFSRLDKALQAIDRADAKNGKRHAFITREYFLSMARHFDATACILPPRAPYVMVVGNCQVSGIDVDVASIMADVASAHGFSVCRRWGYKIKNRYMRFDRGGRGGIISHDWVMEMRRVAALSNIAGGYNR